MKKLLILLLWILIIAFGAVRFGLINKYRPKQPPYKDTSGVAIPNKK